MECGKHGAAKVVDFIKKSCRVIDIPHVMADRLSDDPECDARRIADLMRLFMEYGLLEKKDIVALGTAADGGRLFARLANRLSAFVCTRGEFAARARPLADELRTQTYFHESGVKISMRRAFEIARLWWPCVFKSDEIEVATYDPYGEHEFCPRCYFSTLDTDSEKGVWKGGCPKCGYTGYLLGLEKWRGSYMQNMPVGPPDCSQL